MKKNMGTQDSYYNLANAIVAQAAHDYRESLVRLSQNRNGTMARSEKEECERFFRSQWYEGLSSNDGEKIMEKIREEVFNSLS